MRGAAGKLNSYATTLRVSSCGTLPLPSAGWQAEIFTKPPVYG